MTSLVKKLCTFGEIGKLLGIMVKFVGQKSEIYQCNTMVKPFYQ